ncbi:MAG: hypothetical protein KAJ01_01875 [Candidatus Hydrogenedentes bacterium]|nr:hypothetical protein [Candidatus Hydrogenedentota bacterium]
MNSLADAAAAMEAPDWEEVKQTIIDDRQEKRILDNIGITVNMAELPSAEATCKAGHRIYGSGRLSGFWHFTVLRNLFPNRHQKLVEEWRELYGQLQREFLEAVMKEGRIAFDERQAET